MKSYTKKEEDVGSRNQRTSHNTEAKEVPEEV